MKKVLIVDDDAIFLKTIVNNLEKHKGDFEVITAGDGAAAIHLLGKESADLLITDIKMPKIDGITLLAYVNEYHPKIPCFAMTAYETPEIRKQLPDDILRFLKKPFPLDTLGDTIQKALSRDVPRGAMGGISVASFLMMIEMERKTCLFEVLLPDGKNGFFYFSKGIMQNAVYGPLTGDDGAMMLIAQGKGKAQFKFKPLPDKKIIPSIEKSLPELLKAAH
ncbi:response regulator [Desulfobacterales bacterium HSG17]|nr:response regulator [Desulfobacterales bacterium HSG17]